MRVVPLALGRTPPRHASARAPARRSVQMVAALSAMALLAGPADAQTAPPGAPQTARPNAGPNPGSQPGAGAKPGVAPSKAVAATEKVAAGPVGVWIDDTGKGAIEIKPCGANLCGNIVWLAQPLGSDGQPQNDGNNPEKAKRQQRVCGLQVLGDVKPQSDGTWDQGWVYDPKVGKSYDLAFALEAKDRLKVTGYKGVKFLSKTFVWTRATAPLPSCDGAVTRASALPGQAGPPGGTPQVGKPNDAATPTKTSPPAAARASGVTPPPAQPRP